MDQLALNNVSKSYGSDKNSIKAVADVSFTVKSGEIFGLLGLNGAGKTSLIKMITGLMNPDQGDISVFGVEAGNTTAQLALGAVLEGNRNLYWRMTALENIQYFGVLKGMSIKEASKSALVLLTQFGLIEKKNILVSNLSRGMQQKLAILISLVHSPQLLILDEPTLGLDVASVEMLKNIIKSIAKEKNVAILLTSHDLSFVSKLASHFGIIKQGQLVKTGKMSQLDSYVENAGYEVELESPMNPSALASMENFADDDRFLQCQFRLPKEAISTFLASVQPSSILKLNVMSQSLEYLLQE